MHISKLTEMIETTNKTIRQEGEELLKKDFQEMFEKHPKLEWVAWQQYTPFFNDGDVCTFSVGDLYYRLEGDEQQDDLCDYNYAASYSEDKTGKALGKWWDKVKSDEIFLHVFGDHVQVTATRDSIKVEEYDHD